MGNLCDTAEANLYKDKDLHRLVRRLKSVKKLRGNHLGSISEDPQEENKDSLDFEIKHPKSTISLMQMNNFNKQPFFKQKTRSQPVSKRLNNLTLNSVLVDSGMRIKKKKIKIFKEENLSLKNDNKENFTVSFSGQNHAQNTSKYSVYMQSSRIDQKTFEENSKIEKMREVQKDNSAEYKGFLSGVMSPSKSKSEFFSDVDNDSFNEYTIRTIGSNPRFECSWSKIEHKKNDSFITKNLIFSKPNSSIKPGTRSTVTVRPIETSETQEMEDFEKKFENYQKSVQKLKKFKRSLNFNKQSKDYLRVERKDGYGTEEWEDGSKYQGFWENGKKNGKGLFFWSDGTSYCGNFKNDFLCGFGNFFLFLTFFRNLQME